MERRIALAKAVIFLACLLPAGYYALGMAQDSLGANPIEALTRGLGDWALRLLLVTLTITPLRRLTGQGWLVRLRRMLGLFAFFYACLHFLSYLWLDQFFDWVAIGQDIVKRPFITVGMATFVLLVPLAITSSNVAIRRLGGRRWQSLHRLIYPLSMLAVLHFTWMVKVDIREPMIYGIILAVLLGMRLWWYVMDARRPLLEQRRRIIPIQTRR
ncbi:MAG TPA: protein-methionine-sulfoxide reductase heme-binding subunit MsrQ [Rhodocyclaceae bacterium]|nr:protein-methionine-sulfoxide reductase heme-binding subunit MsrQ [Rhodocyclaceae bacterium]